MTPLSARTIRLDAGGGPEGDRAGAEQRAWHGGAAVRAAARGRGAGKLEGQFAPGSRANLTRPVAFFSDGKAIAFESYKCHLVIGDILSGRSTIKSPPDIIRTYRPGFQMLASGKVLRLEANATEYAFRCYSPGGAREDTRWRQPQPHGLEDFAIQHWAASPDGKTLALREDFGLGLWSFVTSRRLLLVDTGGYVLRDPHFFRMGRPWPRVSAALPRSCFGTCHGCGWTPSGTSWP